MAASSLSPTVTAPGVVSSIKQGGAIPPGVTTKQVGVTGTAGGTPKSQSGKKAPVTTMPTFPNTFAHVPNLGTSELFNNNITQPGWDVGSSWLFGELPGYKDSGLNKAVVKNQKAQAKALQKQLNKMAKDKAKAAKGG